MVRAVIEFRRSSHVFIPSAAILVGVLLVQAMSFASAQVADSPSTTASRPASRPAVERIDTIIAAIREKHDVPALGGAVIRGGLLKAIGVDGVRSVGSEARVTIDDKWHLGSCTKSMTAALAAFMVEEKQVEWTTTVGDILSPHVPNIHEQFAPVTMHMLLTNHGGAPNNIFINKWPDPWNKDDDPVESRLKLDEGILSHPPQSPPGTKNEYSNGGFSIAGSMLETIAKKPFEELMTEKLFKPLGIESAGFGAPGDADKIDQPFGHRIENGKVVPVKPGRFADNNQGITPAGRVHMTLEDWAKYIGFHLDGVQGRTKLLDRKTFDLLHRPWEKSDYAMGFAVTKRGWTKGRVLTHSGSNTMWFCVVWMALDDDFAVIATCNIGGDRAAKACDEVSATLLGRIKSSMKE